MYIVSTRQASMIRFMTQSARSMADRGKGRPRNPRAGWPTLWKRYLPYAAAAASVVGATGVAFLLQKLPLANLAMVYLVVVIVVASYWGRGPSLLASILSFLTFNYFFTVPYYTLRVDSRDDVSTLFFFLVMAMLAGNLAARMHGETEKSKAALARVSALYDFSRRMAGARTAEEILQALCEHLCAALHCAAAVMMPDGSGNLSLKAASDSEFGQRLARVIFAAQQYWKQSDPQAPELPGFLLLHTARDRFGLAALERTDFKPERHELVQTLCDQAAAALERVRLAGDLEKAHLESETERLRSALLSSVSHDLRTPLASIIGSSSSLLEYGETFSRADRQELLTTVLEEARRLDRYIQNLLDMTRLGQGGLSLHRDWVDVNDLIADATDRLASPLKGLRVKVDVSDEAALLHVHGVFVEQVLINLLDNAARYSLPDQEIGIRAWRAGENILIEVTDQGPGIPESEREKIFEMFHSVRDPNRAREGAGLGLAICRGLVGAHGGTIEARDGPGGRGACLRISLPYTEPGQKEAVPLGVPA